MSTKRKHRKKAFIFGGCILLIALAGVLFAVTGEGKKENHTEYELGVIERRDIENIVSCSGSLEPVGTVHVLAQMTGTVEKIYADYNDRVEKNQKLLDLNTDILEIQAREAASAVMKSRASYEHALLEYNNNLKLYQGNLISDFDLHTSETELAIAEAGLESALAQKEKIDMELNSYALILSPINGIVLDRNVDVGDTVTSGSSSTELFTLAEDLSAMEIHAEVDELDISMVHRGQSVRFTVDTYPEKTFSGTVRQIRLMPEEVNSIIIYTVIVDAENPDGLLLPGMTANLDFIIELKEDVLTAPNSAFRFQPGEEEKAEAMVRFFEERIAELPEDQQAAARERLEKSRKLVQNSANNNTGTGVLGGMPFPGGPRRNNENSSVSSLMPGEGKTLWYLDDEGRLSVMMVKTGVTDGLYTEILGEAELEGREIIVKIRISS